uniref:Uncharacterized protein n=1 Tax=Vombatus ursinus TaxID=29139 RepID=A0A4X2KSA3_VOMUR
MKGDQKSVFAQEKQDFVQHFSQIVNILTEDGMRHLEMGDAITRCKEMALYSFFCCCYVHGRHRCGERTRQCQEHSSGDGEIFSNSG